MGTWTYQSKSSDESVTAHTQHRIEFARKKAGDGSSCPNGIICTECYDKLLDGTTINLKDGSTKTATTVQLCEVGTSGHARRHKHNDAHFGRAG